MIQQPEYSESRLGLENNFSIGNLFSKTFKFISGNIAFSILIMVLFFVSDAISKYFYLIVLKDFFATAKVNYGAVLFANLISMLISAFIQAFISYGIVSTLKNEKVAIGQCLRSGARRLFPIAATTLLFSLGVGLGFVALLIPGIILMCLWAFAIPVCAVEGVGPIESLKRSAFLVKNYRLELFFLIVISSILSVLIIYSSTLFVGYLNREFYFLLYGFSLLRVFVNYFFLSMYVVAYFDVRSIKEGLSLEKLTNVFT